jgi:hypothetical protein
METAYLNCNRAPGPNPGEYKVRVLDINGRGITGTVPENQRYLKVGILECKKDRAFVSFEKGLSESLAWIPLEHLN